MSAVILSNTKIQKIKKSDKLYGNQLQKSYDGFKQILYKIPSYSKYILDAMNKDDTFRAVLPKEILERI